MNPVVGILARQGDFEAHARIVEDVGGQPREVRTPAGLEGLDALIIPGGESTTMTLGIEREGLAEPLRDFVRSGKSTLGTCAGLIMLDRDHLALMDVACRLNAFDRQRHRYEAHLDIAASNGGPLPAVCIRAPWVENAGEGGPVLSTD